MEKIWGELKKIEAQAEQIKGETQDDSQKDDCSRPARSGKVVGK